MTPRDENQQESPSSPRNVENLSPRITAFEALSGLIGATEEARKLRELMPMQLFHVFLCIAQKAGRNVRELSALTGLSQASISRNTQALTKFDRHGSPGLDVIEVIEDPTNRRRKIYFLNKRGQERINKIIKALETQSIKTGEIDTRTADEYMDNWVNVVRKAGFK